MPLDANCRVCFPIAPKKTVEIDDGQGHLRRDSYRWLHSRESAEVKQWLEVENAYTKAGMAATEALQEELYQEMKARLKEDDDSLPYSWRGYEFFSRTFSGKDYGVHYRRKLGADAEEQVIFDGNARAQGHDYFDLGAMSVSPDNRLLGWAEDYEGNESWTLRVKDLSSGEEFADVLEDCSANIVWASDSRSFWYIRQDKNFRPWQLCHHVVGDSVDNDRVILEEPNERFFLSVYPDRAETWLLVESASTDTSECFIGSLTDPSQPLSMIRPRKTGVEYYPDSDGQKLFIRTNDKGINYRLVTAEFKQLDNWQEVISHRDQITLEDFEIFPGRLVVFERENGLVQVRICSEDGSTRTLAFPDEAWSVGGCDNAEYRADFLRLEYESLNRPPTVYDVDLDTGELTFRRQLPVLGGFNPEEYATRRLMAVSHDGVQVPVSVVGRKESFHQPAPVLVYGYGAYGMSEDPYFARARLNLLDRGMLFAIAHVRGGADLGESWYRDGRRLQKKNSFHDFIACAEHLISQDLADRSKIVISGGSAGGLLTGAALVMRPDLFAGAVLDVPFVDALNSMMNPDLPLTVTEYDEWGDPSDPEVYEYLKSYSPYDNIQAAHYPPQLVMAGLEDRRVQYWEPAKWVAKMRELKTDNNPVFLKTNMGAGHFGASGRYEAMREAAFEQAFILSVAK
ncbi:S9 family peptidase [Sansalvadorimonas sp. 2012CJ34-2]|uniref:S9 family peptidase n=1 Tax=Parendozoicomonas callyspongiae TaxID=2942213 RepID=A0ABT0PBF1_9GAMM|nr:S9 family peptidase [Sansalvadorimonas sp. 2012CJ34-2]MCL6268645.1 S9 family peptidase [Sansalvadorimonas sp. 2012CJ34-2]